VFGVLFTAASVQLAVGGLGSLGIVVTTAGSH
jgi:hypothetical protein